MSAGETWRWLRDMVRNPDFVWVDQDGAEADRDPGHRFGKAAITHWALRPMWMHTFLTTAPPCGCRKRLGLWRTIYCGDHAGLALGENE